MKEAATPAICHSRGVGAARAELPVREKEHTRASDALRRLAGGCR